MLNLIKEIEGAKTIGISGHIRPDGDCVGSTMALYLYLKRKRPDTTVRIFLEEIPDIFHCIKDTELIEDAAACNEKFDVFFAIDCGKERLGGAERLFEQAGKTINIDHHISNPGTGDYNYIVPDASSASELVFDLLDESYIDRDVAMALYIGIIHDTGVLQYSNTSPKTLNIVGKLISYGFDFPKLIEETFYQKTMLQTQILGKVITDCSLLMDGKVSAGYVDRDTMDSMQLKTSDLDGIVNQLRNIKGVDVAIFAYQNPEMQFKCSLRSNGVIDVAKVCSYFGGGGHVRAAGCTISGTFDEVLELVTGQIDLQYKELK